MIPYNNTFYLIESGIKKKNIVVSMAYRLLNAM